MNLHLNIEDVGLRSHYGLRNIIAVVYVIT
jgi:hypothetical protein